VVGTGREEQSRVRWLGMNGKEEQGERAGKGIKPHHCQILHFQFKMYQKTFDGRAPAVPAGDLKRSPKPLSRNGCHGRERLSSRRHGRFAVRKGWKYKKRGGDE
jgi:hypothetical protein